MGAGASRPGASSPDAGGGGGDRGAHGDVHGSGNPSSADNGTSSALSPHSDGGAEDARDDTATPATTAAAIPQAHVVAFDVAAFDADSHDGSFSPPSYVTASSSASFLSGSGRSSTARHRLSTKHRQQLDRLDEDAAHSFAYPIPERPAGPRLDKWDRLHNTVTNCTRLPRTADDWLGFLLPAWRWLKCYDARTMLRQDLVAGLTVGVMVVPQSMSYAKLAGLPVQYGLYSSLVPIYGYALFGSSRQLAIGPVALVSLLLSTGLAPIMEGRGLTDPEDPDYIRQYVTLAVQASFLVGVMNIGLGLARLGFITIFLSHSVISGFISGAAIIIASSQLKYIFGVTAERSDTLQGNLKAVFSVIGQTNWKVFLMGSLAIVVLLLFKQSGRWDRRLRWLQALGPLTVTVVGIALVAGLDLDARGIDVVGPIPRGLPPFSGNLWTPLQDFAELFLPVVSILLIGFMESIAIARKFAAMHKYEIDPSLELVGLGFANFFGALTSAYPVTGSFSRSAVNNDSGAVSGVAGVVTATLVLLVLLLLTFVFELLPTAILGAIVIAGVIGLVDYPEAIVLWRVHKKDFVCWMCAFLGSMFLGVEIGLLVSVVLSLLIVLYESAYPHTAVLGRLPGTTVYRSIKQYPDAEVYEGIVLIRVDAPLYFANAQHVRDKVRKYRLAAEEGDNRDDVRYLIMDLTPVSHVDTTALHVLNDMYDNYQSRNQQLCFSNPSMSVMSKFDASGFTEKVGRGLFFSCTHDAVKWCLEEMDVEALSVHEHAEEQDDNESTGEAPENGTGRPLEEYDTS